MNYADKSLNFSNLFLSNAHLTGGWLNHSGEAFGSVLHITAIVDTVTKLTASSELCYKCAFFTLRKTKRQTKLISGLMSACLSMSATITVPLSKMQIMQWSCKFCGISHGLVMSIFLYIYIIHILYTYNSRVSSWSYHVKLNQ